MENRQSYAEVLDAEAAHGPVRLLRPGEERLGDGRQRVDAVAREEARPREAAAVEPAPAACHGPRRPSAWAPETGKGGVAKSL